MGLNSVSDEVTGSKPMANTYEKYFILLILFLHKVLYCMSI